MLIKYHLIYYALFAVLAASIRDFHPIFVLALILYTIFMVKRTNKWSLLIGLIILLIILRPISSPRLPHTLNGFVTAIDDNNMTVRTRFGKVKVYTRDHFHYHDEISFAAKPLTIRHADNDNGFDESKYLKGSHTIGKVYMTSLLARKAHFSLAEVIEKHLSSNKKMRSYQRLFILGVRDEEISGDYAQMTSLSIVHMFALSGMHVMILYSVLTGFYGLVITKSRAEKLAMLSLGFYVLSIPFNISLWRAFFMLVLGDLFKDRFSSLDILAMLVLANLFYNPYVLYSVSFVFSYFIYFLVLLIGDQPHSDLIIYMGSVPIVLNLNFSINLLSFLLADLLVPFVKVFYIVTCGSLIFPVLKPVVNEMIIIFSAMMRMTGDLSQTITFQKPNLFFFGVYYYAYGSILYHLNRPAPIKRYVLLLISLMISFHIYSSYKIYSEIGMINVGQGDCSYIRLPFNQGNFLIDTGGNTRYDVAVNTVIPFLKSKGIDHLDAVYISHSDFDHSGALTSLQKNFKVKKVITSYQKPKKIGPLSITFLPSDHHYGNANDDCQVQLVRLNGWSYLFTGDMSAVREADLYKKYGRIHVDVLKVGHHGSRFSSSVTLFEMVHPKIAFIGVGQNNRYGHPSDEVIDRLRTRGIYILRTDQDGNFCIRDYGRHHYVYR